MRQVASANWRVLTVCAVIAFALGAFAARADAVTWSVDPVGGVPVSEGDTAPGVPDAEPLFTLSSSSDDWKCTDTGSVVTVGAAVAAAEAGPSAAVIGLLSGLAWTHGCRLGAAHNDPPTIIDGLPRHHSASSFYAVHWVHWANWKSKHARWLNQHPTWLRHQRTWFDHHHWGAVRPIHKRYWYV